MEFDQAGWRERCERWGIESNHGSGLVYELSVEKFSGYVDAGLAQLPEAHRDRAREIAATDFCYLTPQEIEVEREAAMRSGLCTHYLEPDCCPLGCGDLNQ